MGQQGSSQENSCCNLVSFLQGKGRLKVNKCYEEDPELYEIDLNKLFISHKRAYSDKKSNRRDSRTQTEGSCFEKLLNFSSRNQSEELIDNSLTMLRQHSCRRRLFVDNGKYVLQDSLETNAETARNHQSENKENNNSGLNLPTRISYGLINSEKGISGRNLQQSKDYFQQGKSFLSTPKQHHIFHSPGTEKWREFLDNFNLKQASNRMVKQQSKQQQKPNQYINYSHQMMILSSSEIELNQIKTRGYTNGDMIIGRFLEGIPEGEVKYLKSDGSFYQGQFIAGKATGYGIYRGSQGFYYEGYWLNNYPSGFGKAVYQNKIIYQGSFSLGKKHGKGILKQSGYKYQGCFKNDAYQGEGSLFINGFLIYKGEWKNNLMDGFGQYFQTSQQRYEGEFKKGKKCGYGVMTYPNGDVYEGYWKEDIRSGLGTLKTKHKIISGSWVRNKIIELSQATASSD